MHTKGEADVYRLSACYGEPIDRDEFDRHYTGIHVPLALKLPGLVDFTTGKCEALDPSQRLPFYMVASLTFETAADLQAALSSPEMTAAVEDVPKFATGGLTLYTTEEISRS
jgi:uncharacterized protein (TIGR02118 family)